MFTSVKDFIDENVSLMNMLLNNLTYAVGVRGGFIAQHAWALARAWPNSFVFVEKKINNIKGKNKEERANKLHRASFSLLLPTSSRAPARPLSFLCSTSTDDHHTTPLTTHWPPFFHSLSLSLSLSLFSDRPLFQFQVMKVSFVFK
jgi:hypothetical protein